MPDSEASEILSAGADAALEAALGATEGTLHSFVEFDREGYNALYIPESTRAIYPSEEAMFDHFDRLHQYVNLDFAEIDLFTEDLLPIANEVRYKTTSMDAMTFVRFYVTEDRGIFFAVDPNESVEPIAAAIEDTLEK